MYLMNPYKEGLSEYVSIVACDLLICMNCHIMNTIPKKGNTGIRNTNNIPNV